MVTLNGTDIKLWDEWNKYIWRRVEGNSVELWDKNNNYIWGNIDKQTAGNKSLENYQTVYIL